MTNTSSFSRLVNENEDEVTEIFTSRAENNVNPDSVESSTNTSTDDNSLGLTFIPVSVVDTIELALTNGLGLILIVQLALNLFAKRLFRAKAHAF